MKSSKIKNIILFILILVNVFLAAAAITDSVQSKNQRRQELDGVRAVMEANGIRISDAVLNTQGDMEPRSVHRDLDAEKKRVSSVLGGKVSVEDQGGNLMRYVGDRGTAQFSGTGTIRVEMNKGAVPEGADLVDTARSFLRKLGIQTSKESARVEGGSVELVCMSGDAEVANCTVTCTFENGSLTVQGTRVLTAGKGEPGSETSLDFPSILMRFLEIVRSGGHVCSELLDAELCYVQNASVSGTGTLTPMWRLTTDTGTFYLNPATGRQESVV